MLLNPGLSSQETAAAFDGCSQPFIYIYIFFFFNFAVSTTHIAENSISEFSPNSTINPFQSTSQISVLPNFFSLEGSKAECLGLYSSLSIQTPSMTLLRLRSPNTMTMFGSGILSTDHIAQLNSRVISH